MKNVLLFLSTILLFASCEEVIDLKLKDASPQFIIESTLNDVGEAQVILSYSTSYFGSDNTPLYENDAKVEMSDENGISYSLNIAKAGHYTSNNVATIIGKNYTLKIKNGNNQYIGNGIIPSKTKFDTVYTRFESNPFGDENFQFYYKYTDPANESNFYRIKAYIYDVYENKWIDTKLEDRGTLTSDKFTNGNTVERNFDLGDEFKVETGDSVLVELWNLNKETFDFYSSLSEVRDQSPNSIAPTNPISNINGAVGCFATVSIDKYYLKVQ